METRKLVRRPVHGIVKLDNYVLVSEQLDFCSQSPSDRFVLVVPLYIWEASQRNPWNITTIWVEMENVWFGVVDWKVPSYAEACHNAARAVQLVTGFRLINYQSKRDIGEIVRNWLGLPSKPKIAAKPSIEYGQRGYISLRECARVAISLRGRKTRPKFCKSCGKLSKFAISYGGYHVCSAVCQSHLEKILCRLEEIEQELAQTQEQRQKEALEEAKRSHQRIKKLLKPLSHGAKKSLQGEFEQLKISLK